MPISALIRAFETRASSLSRRLALAALALVGAAAPAHADTLILSAEADTSIFSEAPDYSNGIGEYLFAGSTASNVYRRALIRFDLSAIPAGSTITSVQLRLYMSRTRPGSDPVRLHRVNGAWFEGDSDAPGQEGTGEPCRDRDATWIYRTYDDIDPPNSPLWTTPGGDFEPVQTASLTIGNTGFYTWTSTSNPRMIQDAQAWVNGTQANNGWILIGNEATDTTAVRFNSRQYLGTAANRPQLTIVYTPAATGSCCLPGNICQSLTAAQCAAQSGVFAGVGTNCTTNPCAPVTGACCLPNATCASLTAAQCAAQNGQYAGDNVPCAGQDCPWVLTPFVDALPRPGIAQPTSGQPGGTASYSITRLEIPHQFHRDMPSARVWGYNGFYPGPTIEAFRDAPVNVVWDNNIRDPLNQLRTTHPLPIDTCMHGPDTTGQVPLTVSHVHGSVTDPTSDGEPDAAYPPGADSGIFNYPNNQRAGTIWYHDHALGITRLNVYMGLAGFYLLRDAEENALNLPSGEFEVPLAIQDRSFNADGSLRYPALWNEDFFGDFTVVNGKVWPFLDVKRGKYRFRVLNGSNSRTYALRLSNNATFWQIGTDGGLLSAPAPITELTIQPGERADVLIDFAPYAPGTGIVLQNWAPAPYAGASASSPTGDVMRFVVQSAAGDTDPVPAVLSTTLEVLQESQALLTRELQLRKITEACAGSIWTINGLLWDDLTEFPELGTTEIWSWVNRSSITHPMHMHLTYFQVLDRQNFTMSGSTVVPTGPRVPPPANERGWKDTVQAHPNQITRVIVRFEGQPGAYPYHCHLLEHEDHEMMRRFVVTCNAPQIALQPSREEYCEATTIRLSVGATGSALTYEWRRNGAPLIEGPQASGAVATGVNTASLVITGATAQDAGTYSVRVFNVCGSVVSSNLAVAAPACDCVDYNRDGVFPDDGDLTDFIFVLGGGTCATCGDVDFNNDGVFPDDSDLGAFLFVLGGGSC